VKEAQAPHVLRKMVSLQTELVKQNPVERPNTPESSIGGINAIPRNLLSANFVPGGKTVVNAAGSFGRGVLTAGDRLRDLIVPESLASVVGGWSNAVGNNARDRPLNRDARHKAQLRDELDELLTASCPLCDSMVRGLDKPFVEEVERDDSWSI